MSFYSGHRTISFSTTSPSCPASTQNDGGRDVSSQSLSLDQKLDFVVESLKRNEDVILQLKEEVDTLRHEVTSLNEKMKSDFTDKGTHGRSQRKKLPTELSVSFVTQ